jgi:hypothetical protein
MTDLLIKIPDRAVAISRLKALGLDELITKDEDGAEVIAGGNADVSVIERKWLLLVPGVDDAEGKVVTPGVFDMTPHLLVRLVSDKAMAKASRLDGEVSALEVVANPGTIRWATAMKA